MVVLLLKVFLFWGLVSLLPTLVITELLLSTRAFRALNKQTQKAAVWAIVTPQVIWVLYVSFWAISYVARHS